MESRKIWIDTSGKILDPPIRNSKYAFHIQKSIYKKSILDPPIRNRIRLPDLAIHKSIIHAKFAFETPLHPEKKNESVPD